MSLAGSQFLNIEFDFVGKNTIIERKAFVKAIAKCLEDTYATEIKRNNGKVEFFYIARSMVDLHDVTTADLEQLEIDRQAGRLVNQKKYDDEI